MKHQLQCYIFTRFALESPEESGKAISESPTASVTSKPILLYSFEKTNSHVNSDQKQNITRATKTNPKKTYLGCEHSDLRSPPINFTL